MKSLAVFLPGSCTKKEGRIPLCFLIRVSSERDRPGRKGRNRIRETLVIQVGRRFGEYTDSVTLYERRVELSAIRNTQK